MSLVIKIIGAVLIVCASFYVGCSLSKKLFKRRDFFKNFITFLSSLETRIRYDSYDIFTLVSVCADGDNLSYFKFEEQAFSVPFSTEWNKKVEQLPKSVSLTKSDKQLLCDFGSELGKTDVEGQLKHIALYKAIFSKQLTNAEDAIIQKSKLYKTMGFFVGTAAALMMI